MKLVAATKNAGKLREFREILAGTGFELLSAAEAGTDADVAEDGKTFAENAAIKALAVARLGGLAALADDSGLCVDFLDGAPGIYSARYLGEDTDYVYKNNYILDLMKDVPMERRGARYVCAIAAAAPDGRVITEQAELAGYIAYAPAGTGGFGYDPIFFVPEAGMTAAQLTPAQKHAVSHRGMALRQIRGRLSEISR